MAWFSVLYICIYKYPKQLKVPSYTEHEISQVLHKKVGPFRSKGLFQEFDGDLLYLPFHIHHTVDMEMGG
jgi:hypothetical protein